MEKEMQQRESERKSRIIEMQKLAQIALSDLNEYLEREWRKERTAGPGKIIKVDAVNTQFEHIKATHRLHYKTIEKVAAEIIDRTIKEKKISLAVINEMKKCCSELTRQEVPTRPNTVNGRNMLEQQDRIMGICEQIKQNAQEAIEGLSIIEKNYRLGYSHLEHGIKLLHEKTNELVAANEEEMTLAARIIAELNQIKDQTAARLK